MDKMDKKKWILKMDKNCFGLESGSIGHVG